MANLLDGVRKSDKSEIAKQLCDFKIYSISVMLHIVWQCIYFALVYVYRGIMKICKREVALPIVRLWKERYEMQYESCIFVEADALEEELLKVLKRKMRLMGLTAAKSEDRVSAEITKVVSRLYPGEDIKGLSVLEMNDYIFKNYPHQKKLDEKMCLRLWLIVSFFVFAVAVIFCASKSEFRNLIAVSCVLTEMLWGYWVFYRLTQWQLAHFVWMGALGLGHPFSPKAKGATSNSHSRNNEKLAKDFLIYHSLISLKNQASEKESLALLEDLIAVRECWEMDKLKQGWEKCFPRIECKDGVIKAVVNQFAFADFESIEQRLTELSQVKDPAALAEKRKSEYTMKFRTVQGDIASLYFTASRNKDKRLCISRMERKEALKIVPMTKEKLQQILKKEEHHIAAFYQDYLNTLIPEEQKLEGLVQDVKKLEEQIEERKARKQRREAELMNLDTHIAAREKECEEIRRILMKKGMTDSEYEVQRKAFLKAQREIPSLKNDYKNCETRLKMVSEEYDTFVCRKEILQKEISELNRRIADIRKNFSEELNEAVKEKQKQDRRDVDYLLGEMLIRKMDL